MDNKTFSKMLETRTKNFAISIIRLSVKLPRTTEGQVIRNQITKSGTSIGANYREANHVRSKADFLNKLKICESEISETMYWLELIAEVNWLEEKEIEKVMNEADELLSIFISIVKKLKT
jgi:four helix bundle protein